MLRNLLNRVAFASAFAFVLTLTALPAFAQAGLEFGPNGKIVGKVLSQGTPPTVGTCGTGAAMTAGSTDVAGKFTMGTSASNACTVTFSAAWTAAPFCVVQNATTGAGAFSTTVSTTALTIGGTAADSSVFFYHCIGSR